MGMAKFYITNMHLADKSQ